MFTTYLALAAICFAGAILQTSIGFGHPVFAMIFYSMLFPLPTATTICQTSGIVGVAYIFFKYIKQVRWKVLLPFLLCAIVSGTYLTWYSNKLNMSSLKIYMGIVLALIAVFMVFLNKKIKLKPTPAVGCTMGVVSGAMNGFFAIGGPPVALYLLPAINDKIGYLASANAYFFIFKVFNLPLRFMNGSIGKEHIGYLVCSMVFMTLGTKVGEKVMLRINKELLSKLVYIFVFISGVIIVVQELLKR